MAPQTVRGPDERNRIFAIELDRRAVHPEFKRRPVPVAPVEDLAIEKDDWRVDPVLCDVLLE